MEKVGRGNKVRQATLGKRGKRGQDSARPTDRSALLPLPKGRTSPNSLDLSLYIPAALTTLASIVSASASAIYRPKFGVGITDWRIMAVLGSTPWISAAQICEETGIDKGAVSRSLVSMQSIKVIEMVADPSDQRRQFVALTKTGLKLHDRIARLALQREDEFLEGFSAQERRTLINFIMRLQQRVSTPDDGRPAAKPGKRT